MPEYIAVVLRLFIRKAAGVLERAVFRLLRVFCEHYTWLTVIVLCILGGIWIFCCEWLFRYSRYDWWRWKLRAERKAAFFTLILIAVRLLVLNV